MIYLLRHGEIKGSETRRFIGQTDVGLSPKGGDQARFWQGYFNGIKLDRVFSSPLSRCIDTARIVTGLADDGIIRVHELREIDLGAWDGQPFAQVKALYPRAWAARGNDLVHYRPPGGESFADLFDRVVPAFQNLVHHDSGNSLIVAHAGVNRMILCHLLGKDPGDLFTIDQAYGCLNIISGLDGPDPGPGAVSVRNLRAGPCP